MNINTLDLNEICEISERVYFNAIDQLNIEDKCIEDDPDTGGTKNTEFGSDLYYLIENSIKDAIQYQE